MDNIIQKFHDARIVPVISIQDAGKAVKLADALCGGGLDLMEITFRTEAAEEAIRTVADHRPDFVIGAGTVLNVGQVDRAFNAGAKFIVTPGFNPKVVSRCLDLGIHVIPGTLTPSEMEAAMELGIKIVKFFPAEQGGGAEYLKAVGGPYGDLRFVPTGGINLKNLRKYLELKNVIACGGSWMATGEMLECDDFTTISDITYVSMKISKETRWGG